MKILICGGRDFHNYRALANWMSVWITKFPAAIPPLVIIEGGAKGADTLAKHWGTAVGADVIEFPADWEKFGPKAGYLRNVQMLDAGEPDRVIAFPGGKGTAMMIKLAIARGIPVDIVRNEDLRYY